MGKPPLNKELDKQMQRLLKSISADTPMDQVKQILDLAIKYETLKLKDKSGSWGKGFEGEGDGNGV